MVAGEQRPGRPLGVADVVGDVAGGVEALEGEPVAGDHVAVAHGHVGDEVQVAVLLRLRVGPGGVGTEAVGRRAGALPERGGRRGVVGVGVGDEQVRDGLPRHRGQHGVDVGVERRSGVDDGDAAPADDVGAGPPRGELRRVVGHHPADAGGHLHALAVPGVEVGQERDRDHDPTLRPWPQRSSPCPARSPAHGRMAAAPIGPHGRDSSGAVDGSGEDDDDGRDVGRGGGGLRPGRPDRGGVPGRGGAAGAGAGGPRPGRWQHPGVPAPPPWRGRHDGRVRVRRGRALHRRLRAGRAVPHHLRRVGDGRADAVPAAGPRRVRHAALPGPGVRGPRRLGPLPRPPGGGVPGRAGRHRTGRRHAGVGGRGGPGPVHPRGGDPDVRPVGVPAPVGAVRGGRAVPAVPGGAGPLVRVVRGRSPPDGGGHARRHHRPLHAGRLLPRGRRPDDPGPAHPGHRGPRRRGPHPGPGAADRGGGATGHRCGAGGRLHHLRGPGDLQRGPRPHRVRVGGRGALGPGHGALDPGGGDDPGPGVRVPGGGPGPHRRPQHQLLRVPQLRDRRPVRRARRRRAGGTGRVRLRRHGVTEGPRQRRTCARRDRPTCRS